MRTSLAILTFYAAAAAAVAVLGGVGTLALAVSLQIALVAAAALCAAGLAAIGVAATLARPAAAAPVAPPTVLPAALDAHDPDIGETLRILALRLGAGGEPDAYLTAGPAGPPAWRDPAAVVLGPAPRREPSTNGSPPAQVVPALVSSILAPKPR